MDPAPPPIPVRPSPPPPAARSRSGCVTALYIFLGLGVVTVLTLIVAGWLFYRSETGQRLVGVAREGIALSQEALKAPGTSELRTAGCSQAMVMPMDRMFELLGEIAPQARREGEAHLAANTMVMCQIEGDGTAGPGCSEVARVYSAAVPDAPAQFAVLVQGQSSGSRVCEGVYRGDGTLVAPLETGGTSQTDPPKEPLPQDGPPVERK